MKVSEISEEWTPKERLAVIVLIAGRIVDGEITSIDGIIAIRKVSKYSTEHLELNRQQILKDAGIKYDSDPDL